MGFRIKFFVLCAVLFGTVCPGYADMCQCGYPGNMCDTSQHCVEQQYWDPDAQMWDYDYFCEECPAGLVHNPNDCFTCIQSRCEGYGDCPAGVGGNGKKCNEVSGGCPNGTGCREYEVCDMANGAITYEVTGSCHIEEVAMCQPNNVSCNQFPIESQFAYFSIVPNDQNGTAEWSFEKVAWNTINCKLNATNKNLSTITVMGHTLEIQCKNFNVMGEVRGETNQYRTKTVYDPVYYSLTRNYCAKCREGYLPKPQPSPDASVYYVPAGYDSSPYGVMFCDALVPAPYYAPGCTIPYPLNSSSMPEVCRVPCPDNMETVVNGATSINDCVPTGVTYNDSTGSFRLGSDSSLCTP